LIEVKVSTPEIVEEIVEIEKSVPLMLLVEGYDTVTPEKKFVLDVLVFNAEKYPQSSPTFNRNADYTVDGVNVEIELHNEEGQIHTFSGTTKDGFLRYEILARETSQDGTLWMINNLYTVDVSVSLDDQSTGKTHQFFGGANYDKGSAVVVDTSWSKTVLKTVEINDSTANGPELINSDTFGTSVANIGDLNGDGVDDLAVGAADDNGSINRGAIHILFMNTDGSVDSTEEINSSTTNGPDLASNDFFGRSIANIGDLDNNGFDDLAVGATGDNEGGDNRGAIHILFMDGDPGNGLAKATEEINSSTTNGPDLDDDDEFGRSIANIGDWDGNGVDDIAVGADMNGANNKGAIHILFMDEDPENGLAKAAVEINDDTANGPAINNQDKFGISIANIGDLNGDGVNDIAVGAHGADTGESGGNNAGEVHIMFMNTDGTVDSTEEINYSTENGPELAGGDNFGTSIVNIGDLDGDGVNDIAVGAEKDEMDENGDSSGGDDRGAVHIFHMNMDGTIDSTVEINDSTENGPVLEDSDWFGRAVVNLGDWDGNGVNDLAVGAHGDDNSGNARGAVHILFLE
jgi:hypothetical protein